jgi:tellurite methyltransferase
MLSRIEWDERYRAGQQVFETPGSLVVQFTQDVPAGTALDLACGPGRNAVYLAALGWKVTAIDGSSVAIELLRSKSRSSSSIDARVADLEAGELEVPPESFDLVLSSYYLQRSLIPLMQSALRPGGMLIMIVHLAGVDQPQGTPTRAYSGELSSFFQGWRILHYREGAPGEPGHRHAVAELVAQKST